MPGRRAQGISPDLYAGLTWRSIGPFDGGPVASVAGVPGEAGIYVITTPSGGTWKTIDGGETWTSIDRQDIVVSASSDPHRWTDPANPRRIVRTDAQGIAVSLDGGSTWMASHRLAIAEVPRLSPREHQTEPAGRRQSINGSPVNVSIADPARAGLIFAGTSDVVYVSFDDGARWASLRLNLPSVAINDLDIRGNSLVAATQGRSIWELDDISPLRQISAATASAGAVLFKPADAALKKSTADPGAEPSLSGVNVDYYLGATPTGEVRLEILSADGRVVHAATSAPTDKTDRWMPVMRPLPASAGQHRVTWDLRVDPPPARKHQYAHFAPTLFQEIPADPNGPLVLPGNFRVRLIVSGHVYTQPLVVARAGDTPATLEARRRTFDLAMKMYDAMRIAHQGFVQLARVRAALKPLLTSPDPDVALAATGLDTQLASLDGSSWTGLVIPDDEAGEVGEVDEKEGKHPDFVPPVPVSLSKDYDDPTSILGRTFNNVNHPLSFATVSATFGDMLTKAADAAGAPDDTTVAAYEQSCQQLSGVLEAWQTINAQDLARVNAGLAARKLPLLPIAESVPAIVCAAK